MSSQPTMGGPLAIPRNGISEIALHALWWAILTPKCFYTQNNQFSMFFPTVVVGGVSECWVRPPSAARCRQDPANIF